VYFASRAGQESLWATAAQAATATLAASLSGRLLFLHPQGTSGPRVDELEQAAFAAGLFLTPPLASLGTWALDTLAFGGRRYPSQALFGALQGAVAATLVALALDGLLEHLSGAHPALASVRHYLAFSLIGSAATLGYHWAGGGPNPNP
jgi:hypothetical protein